MEGRRMEEKYGADITRGMKVRDRVTRRQRPRSVDVSRADRFWGRFEEVDG